eukprot:s640_g16.t1
MLGDLRPVELLELPNGTSPRGDGNGRGRGCGEDVSDALVMLDAKGILPAELRKIEDLELQWQKGTFF